MPTSLKKFYHQSYSAVTDFLFYKTIFTQPLRKTLLYLVLLSAHVAVAQTLIIAWQQGPQFLEICRWAEQNFPTLEVRDGRLWVNSDQPLIKRYRGEQLITFVFDTSGTYSDPREIQEPAILFTQEKLYLRMLGQTQTYYWKDFGPFQISPEAFREAIILVEWIYFPTFYPLLLGYNLLAKALLAVVLSVIALSASARNDVQLPFEQSFAISLYSLTPAVVIDLAVTMTGIEISYFNFFYVATAVIYTYLATQKCVVMD